MINIRDMKLAVTLLALGHTVHDIEIDGSTCYFVFSEVDTEWDRDQYKLRKTGEIAVPIYLDAMTRFKMGLMQRVDDSTILVTNREAVVALIAMGHEVEDVVQEGRLMSFAFPEYVKAHVIKLVNKQADDLVTTESYWGAYRFFVDTLRNT